MPNYFNSNLVLEMLAVNSNCGFKAPFQCNFGVFSNMVNSFD